ncbi:MAG TPA: hypothetical protein VGZ29_06315 [Terriglobia bacterium]|nr:hypothetical protein [Terriglobia bacterium]
MGVLTSNSTSKKPPSPGRMRAQRANAQRSTGPRTREGRRRSALNRPGAKASGWRAFGGFGMHRRRDFLRVWRDLVALFWFITPEDGRSNIVTLRESIEARRSSFAEAEKTAKKPSVASVQANPSLYPSAEIGVNPVFVPPTPEIFKERTQSRKPKTGKELGLEWPRFRVRF